MLQYLETGNRISIDGIAVLGGALIAWGLYLIILFFSSGGSAGQYWNWGWALLIPGSTVWTAAAILYWRQGPQHHR